MSWETSLEALITQLPLVAYVVWRLEGRVRKISSCLERLRSDVEELRRRSDPPPPVDRDDPTPLPGVARLR